MTTGYKYLNSLQWSLDNVSSGQIYSKCGLAEDINNNILHDGKKKDKQGFRMAAKTKKEKFSIQEPYRISFIFVPFIFKGNKAFETITDRLNNSDSFYASCENEFKYMLKYISDKMGRQYNHFSLRNSNVNTEIAGVTIGNVPYQVSATEITRKSNISDAMNQNAKDLALTGSAYTFCIQDIHIYSYKSLNDNAICFLAYQVEFDPSDRDTVLQNDSGQNGSSENVEDPDVRYVANALYLLKKLSRNGIFKKDDPKRQFMSLLDISNQILSSAGLIITSGMEENRDYQAILDFYQPEEYIRANCLTLLESDKYDDISVPMYSLRWCYYDRIKYVQNPDEEKDALFSIVKGINWGVSSEAAACMVNAQFMSPTFLRETFIHNFQSQYLAIFTFLLHQKYFLYWLLERIGNNEYNNLESLISFQKNLYAFENSFVYSFVTEVPQYQILYNRLTKAFSIKELFEDVNEPLIALREEREKEAEKTQKEKDEQMNQAFNNLALLACFSALIDGISFIEKFVSWFTFLDWLKPYSGIIIMVLNITIILLVARICLPILFHTLKKDDGR